MRLPRVIGHRGAAALAPENTLEGLRVAARLGVRWVEVDAKLSADGVVVLFHDETLDRTTDGNGPVAATRFAVLRRLDAGAWFGPAWRGPRVPTLEQALDLLSELGLRANVEIKPCPGREAKRRGRGRGDPARLAGAPPAAAALELPAGLPGGGARGGAGDAARPARLGTAEGMGGAGGRARLPHRPLRRPLPDAGLGGADQAPGLWAGGLYGQRPGAGPAAAGLGRRCAHHRSPDVIVGRCGRRRRAPGSQLRPSGLYNRSKPKPASGWARSLRVKSLSPLVISGREVLPLVEGGKGISISNGESSGAWAASGGVGTFSGVNADSYDAEGRLIRQVYRGRRDASATRS
jgi:hypothetical protein